MQVILLEKIRNVGALGDLVDVKPGYGLNFLIPQGKAIPGTKANIADFEHRRAELESKAAQKLEKAKERADKVEQLSIEIKALASDEGKLYGSIGTREIADAITNSGLDIKKSEVLLPLGAFHYVGEYEVEIQLHSDVTSKMQLKIVEEK